MPTGCPADRPASPLPSERKQPKPRSGRVPLKNRPPPQSQRSRWEKPGSSLEDGGLSSQAAAEPLTSQELAEPPAAAGLRVRAPSRGERQRGELRATLGRVGCCEGDPTGRRFDFSAVLLRKLWLQHARPSRCRCAGL